MKKLKRTALVIAIILVWTLFVGLGFTNGYLLFSLDSSHSTQGFIAAVKAQAEKQYIGNLGMALIEGGEVAETFFLGQDGEVINAQSSFPVASISKWVTAAGVLKLVEQGTLELDRPVEDYLTRWHLPESKFNNKEVTVSRLLSHSAGLDDDLGYGGFVAGEQIQTLEESLTSAADGYYDGAKARVGYEPGSQFMYSGASYTLLQLLIEEVTGLDFNDYMASEIFEPLGMTHSSFVLDEVKDKSLVTVYKTNGEARPMKRFTAQAAASLMTSIGDLSKFMMALTSTEELLSTEVVRMMHKPASFRNDFPWYGLGPRLYSTNVGEVRIAGHDGSGNNAINTAARYDTRNHDGIIILETGHPNFASDIADEWLFWQAGIADRVVMERNMPYLGALLVGGYLFIIISAILFFRRSKAKT